jgi:hypothetical protein
MIVAVTIDHGMCNLSVELFPSATSLAGSCDIFFSAASKFNAVSKEGGNTAVGQACHNGTSACDPTHPPVN